MLIAGARGLPVAAHVADASPHEVTLVGARVYDSDLLDAGLAVRGVERLNAWLQNFRRVTVRWGLYYTSYLGMVHLACMMILLRHL